jgi:hypothetical protein
VRSAERHSSNLREDATHAVATGLRFLEEIQQADGSFPTLRWRAEGEEEVDFYVEKTFFTTAFIGSVLLGIAGAEAIVNGVLQFVEAHREPESVWSYLTASDPGAAALPPDVDDTALASLLLEQAGHAVGAAEAVLLSNRDREGRFYTWITVLGEWWRPPRLRILLRRLPDLRRIYRAFKHDPQRIRDLDAGVNANVVLQLGRRPGTEGAIAYLTDVARRGDIADRWYADRFTLWYLISRSLRRHDIDAGATLLEHLASARPKTPLQVAQAACVAQDWAGQVPDEWIAALVAAQSSGGGWERFPLYVNDRGLRWGAAATTTALSLEALSRWLAMTPP